MVLGFPNVRVSYQGMIVLPTFVIGLREGVEASLIVGIVAAFLRQQGRRDALRAVWAGVLLAVTLCVGVAVGLQVLDQALPQRQQEQLETVVATIAVGMVTFMIVWMRRHARGLARRAARERRPRAGRGLRPSRSSRWRSSPSCARASRPPSSCSPPSRPRATRPQPAAGAVLGVLVAVVIGWGIYRGGVRLDLARFFRVTAAVLVLVAAGLVATAIHTAHEAAWLNSLQGQAFDLSWLVRPGTVTSSLVTGVLGIQPQPTVGEVLGWLLYAIPMLAYVLWPEPLAAPGHVPRARRSPPAAASPHLTAHVRGDSSVGNVESYRRRGDASRRADRGRSRRVRRQLGRQGRSDGKAKTVAVSLTDKGCEPAKASVPGRAGHVQREERRHREGHRVRAEEQGRHHHRRAREHRRGHRRLVQPRPGSRRRTR